jgi:Uma2 family endonuclease
MAVSLKTAETTRFYTIDEFMALPLDNDYRYELVRGEIQKMAHPGEEHGLVVDNLQFALSNHVRSKKLGRTFPPVSVETKIPGATRDTARVPDLMYLSKEKITGQSGAVKVIPDLAVEVYSPSDRPSLLKEKLEDYQAAGWDLVWVIYPSSAPRKKQKTVEVYRLKQSRTPVQTLGVNDILDGAEIIPDFKMSIAQLFEYEV